MRLYKYQGAGNDFLIADNREGHITESDGILVISKADGTVTRKTIADLCDRRYGIGADGFMLLDRSETHAFGMRYFNSDGSGGMMCGNGGRCIAAFAADMGLEDFDFEAPDGMHVAEVGERKDGVRIVRLLMKDAHAPVLKEKLDDVDVPSEGWYSYTGTFHYVRSVEGVGSYDVVGEGRKIRWSESFAPVGTNVNFIEPVDDGIRVRTYEKGVEDETNACGTGVVASALSAYMMNIAPSSECDGVISYDMWTDRALLSVSFRQSAACPGMFEDIWLTGPATYVAEILLPDM